MTPFTCDEIEQQIELYAAGECDAPTAAAVRTHLAGCAGCSRAEAEARKFLELLDLRLQEPDRLSRLFDRIEEEVQPAPALPMRRRSPTVARRWLALAASVLLPVGLVAALMPAPVSPMRPEADGPQVALAIVPDGSFRGKEMLPAAVRDPGLELFHAEKAIKFQLASGLERDVLVGAAQSGRPTLPPEVDLQLVVFNASANNLRLRLDDPRAELRLRMTGPDVVRIAVRGAIDPFGGITKLTIPAGQGRALPIPRLVEGKRGRVNYLYWAEPGSYRIWPTLRAPTEGGDVISVRGRSIQFDVR